MRKRNDTGIRSSPKSKKGSGKYTRKLVRKPDRKIEKDTVAEKKVSLRKYSNGLTLLYEPSLNPSLGLSCIYLFVNIGSSQEPDDLRGVSHLIEHMMFKATKRRSENSLLKIFDSTGAKFNAYTNKRLTCFYIICETEHMKSCLDALSEMVIQAIFDKTQLEKEQKIVHEENVQDEDDSENLLEDGVDMVLFDGSHYSTPIDYIHSPLDRKKVVEYYRKHYIPENMALSIVSSESYEAVEKMVAKNPFSRIGRVSCSCSEIEEKQKAEKKAEIQYHPYINYKRYRKENGLEIVYGEIKGYNTVQIAIGFRTCPWKEVRDRELLKLTKAIFDRGMNGRLFNLLRGKHGLAYSPSAGTEYYDTVGKITLYTEIEASKLLWNRDGGKKRKGVLPLMFGLVKDFIEKGPTMEEWEDVKGYLHGERIIAMEKINHLAEYNGKNYWLSGVSSSIGEKGEIDSYSKNWETYIQPTTLEDCRKCIQKYFVPSNMCVVLIGSSLPSIPLLEKSIDNYFP
jgi:predicted Zn-dependent peptidase